MWRGLLILVSAAGAILPVQARLGETQQESVARYGLAVGSQDVSSPGARYTMLTFNHAGYLIVAQFLDDRCEMICFYKPDRSAFTPAELDLLLKAEAEGQAWSRSNLVSSDVIFDRTDGAMARYDTAKHALAFLSTRYVEAADAQKKADAKRQLDNL